MRVLDLFCGAGGASWGYHLAGFKVVGVDNKPQPHYPFDFIEADALSVIRGGRFRRPGMSGWYTLGLDQFDLIHASPPCQAFTRYANAKGNVKSDHVSLIEPTRDILKLIGKPYVIENVPGAPLINPVQLCGTSFPPLEVRRHRLFESSFPITPVPCDHGRLTERKYPGSSDRPNGRTVCNIGEYRVPLQMQKDAIGIQWMTKIELSQAIPPAYTEYIGHQYISDSEL